MILGENSKDSNPVDLKEVFTEAEAQEFLGVSRVTLWNLRTSGRLAYRPIGKRILYRRQDLLDFLDSVKVTVNNYGTATTRSGAAA